MDFGGFFSENKDVSLVLMGTEPASGRNSVVVFGRMDSAGLLEVAPRADEAGVSRGAAKTLTALSQRRDRADLARQERFGVKPLERHSSIGRRELAEGFSAGYFRTPTEVSYVWQSQDPGEEGSESVSFAGEVARIRYAVNERGRGGFDFLSDKLGPGLILLHEQGHCEHKDAAFDPTPKSLPFGLTKSQANTLAILGKMGRGPVAEMISESYADAFAAKVFLAGAPSAAGREERLGLLSDLASFRDIVSLHVAADPHVTGPSLRSAMSDQGAADPEALREAVRAAGFRGALVSAAGSRVSGESGDFDFKKALVAYATPESVSATLSEWIARTALARAKGGLLSASERRAQEELPPWDKTLLPASDPYVDRVAEMLRMRPDKLSNGEALSLAKRAAKDLLAPWVASHAEGGLERIDWGAVEKSDPLPALARERVVTHKMTSVAERYDREDVFPLAPEAPPKVEDLAKWRERRTERFDVPSSSVPGQSRPS